VYRATIKKTKTNQPTNLANPATHRTINPSCTLTVERSSMFGLGFSGVQIHTFISSVSHLGTWIAAGSAPLPLTSQHSSNTLKPTSPCLVSQRTAIRLRASNASAAVTTDKGTISSLLPPPKTPFSPSNEMSSDISVDLESVYVAHHFICIAKPTFDLVSHAHIKRGVARI
jgi:hypothetical protein